MDTAPLAPGPVDAHTLDRYLAGELSDVERQRVDAACGENPTLAALLAQMRGISPAANTVADPDDTAAALAVVMARAAELEAGTAPISQPKLEPHRSARPSWQRGPIIGVVFAIMLIGAAVFRTMGIPRSTLPSTHRYTTRVGERAAFALDDGTHVTLAPHTTLFMVGNVGTLVGEAMFTVSHRTSAPLIVRTGRVTTKVLGTMFDVRRYANETTTVVSVLDGKVMTGMARSATLTARMVARVTDSTILISSARDPGQLNSWIQGRLVFRDTPAADVLREVERWYGITFRMTEPAQTAHLVTATFDASWSRGDVLAVLASVLDVRMTATGDTITLTARPSATRTAPDRLQPPPTVTPMTEIGK